MIELKGKPIREEIIAEIKRRKAEGETFNAYIICNPSSFEASSYMQLVSRLISSLGFSCQSVLVHTFQEAAAAVKTANQDPRLGFSLPSASFRRRERNNRDDRSS